MIVGQPVVSIVVLNWNGGRVLSRCLESVRNQTYRQLEVIIVDNASFDDSLVFAQRIVPNAQFIKNDHNMGFSDGMNQGIQASVGRFVVPLNMDVQLERHFVENAVHAIEQCDYTGMVAAKVYALAGTEKPTHTVVHVGQYVDKRMNLVNSYNLDEPEFVLGPHGCCPFLRREMLEQVRLKPGEYYDSSYFAYYEDVDLWWRAQIAGWRCLFSPGVVAWHVRSGSSDGKTRITDKPRFLQRIAYRNRYATIVKVLPGELVWRVIPYLVVSDLALLGYLLVRHPSSFVELVKGGLQAARRIADTREKRRHIQGQRKVSATYLRSLFRRGWKAA